MSSSSRKTPGNKPSSSSSAAHTQVPRCASTKCDEVCARSTTTGHYTKKCHACLLKARESSRRSYHRKDRTTKERAILENKLAERNTSLWAEKRKVAALREKLATSESRATAFEQSYAESQRGLTAALAVANDGTAPEHALPTHVTTRNEAILLHSLSEIEKRMDRLAELRAGDLTEVEARIKALHADQSRQHKLMLEDLDKFMDRLYALMERLDRTAAACASTPRGGSSKSSSSSKSSGKSSGKSSKRSG